MGKKLQTTSPLKVHNKSTAKKFMQTSRKGLYQSCILKDWGNFKILDIRQFFFSFLLASDYMGEKTSNDA